MILDKKKINSILEYALVIILFLIGIKKGGYYKQDALIGVCVIQIISAIFFLLNIRDIKKNSIVSLFLLIFSISYFIPVIFNATTMSGALNFATRIYTMYLIFCLVSSSENKEKYVKSIVAFTLIFGLLGIDEMSFRILDKMLSSIGSGYLDDNAGKLSSVLQYANILGILCTISILYLMNKIQTKEYSKTKKITVTLLIQFFTVMMFLTQSKMVMLLTIIFTTIFCFKNKKREKILYNFVNIAYGFIASVLCAKFNIILVIILSLAVFTVYNLLRNNVAVANKKVNLDAIVIALILVFSIVNINLIINSSMVTRLTDYFTNFDSTDLRLTYYNDALKIVTKSIPNLLFGIGGNGFRTAYETVQSIEYISLEVHSLFMQVLVESGILGLVSIIAVIAYIMKKSENNIYILMLIALLIFSAFDVFLTYTFMLFVLAILFGMCVDKVEKVSTKFKVGYVILFVIVFGITLSQTLATIIQPVKVDNLNNSLSKQEQVINFCGLSLKLDPYDLDYINNYIVACRTYLDIMDIRKEIYGEENLEKRYEIISKIEKSINNELKYEKNNKYVIEDALYYITKYLDYLVVINYSSDIEQGYVDYLVFLTNNLNKLIVNHGYNDYASQMYEEYTGYILDVFEEKNMLLNSDKINSLLEAIK